MLLREWVMEIYDVQSHISGVDAHICSRINKGKRQVVAKQYNIGQCPVKWCWATTKQLLSKCSTLILVHTAVGSFEALCAGKHVQTLIPTA